MPEKDKEYIQQVMSLADELQKQLRDFQGLAQDSRTACSQPTENLMPKVLDCEGNWEKFAQEGLKLAADFANKGLELGYLFARRGMELGYKFASKGEKVGPMANRILFMATQIGVMADRIGEMADRILFMADKIGEFGDRVVYVSQLIIYTEQLVVNVSVLITETIRILSDLILSLVALCSENEAFIQARAETQQASQALPLIYENMNLMLRQMHEYSLRALESSDRHRENELKIRELQIKLRETTQRANECFCPCFCTDWTERNRDRQKE